jgi:predicted lipid-binding transport protein (Tim44 family)
MHRFLRFVMGMFAIALTLGYLAGDADARVGGGGSFGSRGTRTFSAPPSTKTAPSAAPIQRSTIQPGPAATSPGLGGGFFNRGGLLGGLAGGFIGAGLFGLLFGHGLFGGLGGIASFFGLLLQIGLVVFIARFLLTWWQRRNQPAYAGASGPALRTLTPGNFGLGGGATGGFGASAPAPEITSEDYDKFEHLLSEIQAAYSNEDINALRRHVTPEMLSYFSETLSENASRGVVNRISDVKLEQGDLSEAWREGDIDYATVAMRFALIDKTVERASGRTVDGSDEVQEITEIWTFMRGRGGDWLLSAIQQT